MAQMTYHSIQKIPRGLRITGQHGLEPIKGGTGNDPYFLPRGSAVHILHILLKCAVYKALHRTDLPCKIKHHSFHA
jgi:hypothetical protein